MRHFVARESIASGDLVRRGDPVRITKRSGSRNLHQWKADREPRDPPARWGRDQRHASVC